MRMLIEDMPRPRKEEEFQAWLVPARNNIQRQLLRLRKALDREHPPKVAVALNWLAGVGFSLWRGVFQAREGLEAANVVKASKTFLDKIILDNAAIYQTEMNTWSLGYYLGNARLRMVHLGVRLWPFPELPAKLSSLLDELEKPMTWNNLPGKAKRDPYQEWEDCFRCLCLMLDEIEDE